MLNLECAKPFTIHIHDRSGKFEQIWFQEHQKHVENKRDSEIFL
jgi:hypothetical protein